MEITQKRKPLAYRNHKRSDHAYRYRSGSQSNTTLVKSKNKASARLTEELNMYSEINRI